MFTTGWKPAAADMVFIWIAIVVAAGLLLFLTLKMTKEVKKNQGNDGVV